MPKVYLKPENSFTITGYIKNNNATLKDGIIKPVISINISALPGTQTF